MDLFITILGQLLAFSLGWHMSYKINFKHSENTEGVSNDSDESGVLHGVGESHASEPTDKANQSFDDGTLEKITEDENDFMCKAFYTTRCNKHCGDNIKCPIYPKS